VSSNLREGNSQKSFTAEGKGPVDYLDRDGGKERLLSTTPD
jgi:hypothetical protein